MTQDLHGLWISTETVSHPSYATESLSDAWAVLNSLSFKYFNCKNEESIMGGYKEQRNNLHVYVLVCWLPVSLLQ